MKIPNCSLCGKQLKQVFQMNVKELARLQTMYECHNPICRMDTLTTNIIDDPKFIIKKYKLPKDNK